MLVAMAIISLLTLLILPALGQTKVRSHRNHSLGNARLLAAASALYSAENQGRFVALGLDRPSPDHAVMPDPQRTFWPDLLRPFVENAGAFRAPQIHGVAFGMNCPELGVWGGSLRVADVARPAATVIFANAARMKQEAAGWDLDPRQWQPEDERAAAWLFRVPGALSTSENEPPAELPGLSGAERVHGRYGGVATTIFVDGHADSLRPAQLGFQFPKGHHRAFWDKL
jgi:type II secretory pathway pseudopilin PulG